MRTGLEDGSDPESEAALMSSAGLRLSLLAVVLGAASILAVTAGATEVTIRPGVGIAKVNLGMSATEVNWALGAGSIVNDRKTIGGRQYLELAWNFGQWAVDFVKRGSVYRVVQVGTRLRKQRTRTGVGPGTPWLDLVRAYPHGLCAVGGNPLGLPSTGSRIGTYLEFLVPHKGGTQTIFVLRGIYNPKKRPPLQNYVVMQVQVRVPEWPLSEFAPNSPSRCAPGWEKSRTPVPTGRP
jgi:hypothetical protein